MRMTEKTQFFLNELKAKYIINDDYDYSLIDYKTLRDRVIVKYKPSDTTHLVRPIVLRKGYGCVMENAVDKNKFALYQYKKVHGNKFEYPNFNYKNAIALINVKCQTHGIFKISHNKHKQGRGCPKCGLEQRGEKRKLDTEDVLKSFKDTHGNKYDYSLFVYNGMRKKSKIICKIHGVFEQTSIGHRGGKGCPNCSKSKKLNNDDVLKIIKENYGDEYDISLVQYVNSKTPLILKCKIHGEFKKLLGQIRKKSKCNKCSGINVYTNENIIKEFEKVHGNTYDYSQVQYKNTNTKVKIICKKHGVFEQSPTGHKGGQGCPKCKGHGLSNDEIIMEFRKVHGNTYDYSLVNYKLKKTPIKIICKEHGVFEQKPINHILGKGCPKCKGGVLLDLKYVISEFKKAHGDRYDYSLVKYQSAHKKVKIVCKIHGVFEQTPASHKFGAGCYVCNRGWRHKDIIRFINDIQNEDILEMDPVELNVLISQGKLPKEFEELVFTLDGAGANSLKALKESLGIDEKSEQDEAKTQEIEEKINELLVDNKMLIKDSISSKEEVVNEEIESQIEKENKRGLPTISNNDILVLDKELINNCDDEAVEFFIQYKLRKVWNEVINEKRNPNDIKSLKGGKNSSRLRDLFVSEYDKVLSYKPPAGYSFMVDGKIAPPNMMQKLTVNRVNQYKRYGNWSGTGAGKTLSFIIASREVDARLTVVVCLNSTISQLEEDILDVYPESVVHSFTKNKVFDRSKHNYLLLNYEKFQQGYSEEMFQNLNEKNKVDFIVIDEVHNAKQRDKDESKRRAVLMRFIGRSSENNPGLYLLGMSATPVINNLTEARSLLQLITGKKYDDLKTKGTISNALKVFTQLLINGVRLIPKYEIELAERTGENTQELMINGDSLTDLLLDNNNKDYLGLEKILLKLKLEHVKPFIKPKTILYTYYTDSDRIPRLIAKYIKNLGYKSALYIGEQDIDEREKNKQSFVKGDTDILIASRTIGTGVDGLQKVCNRMIILTLPWTDSEYTQLKGRIYRQGSKFGSVDIIIPQVKINLGNKEWSWDIQRLKLIKQKRSLADAAVDGIIPKKNLPSIKKLCSDSLNALKEWKKRVNEGDIRLIKREDLSFPLKPDIIEYLRPSLGDFSQLNQKWSVTNSKNTFKRLGENKEEWYYYHELYRQKRKEWDEIPYVEIAKKITKRKDWIVADMGCGENLLSKEIPNKVYGFDYVACEPSVTECDITNVPLEDSSVDVVVYSLSLMGSNYVEYLKEGHRILKPFGLMFICEPYKKVKDKLEAYKENLEAIGLNVSSTKNSIKKFVYIDCIKQ